MNPHKSKGLPDGLWAHTEFLHAFDAVAQRGTRITVHAALHVPARPPKSYSNHQQPKEKHQKCSSLAVGVLSQQLLKLAPDGPCPARET